MNHLLNYYEQAVSALRCDATLEQFEINDLLFHAVVAGPKDGELILLLHGFPECWYSWRFQIPVLVKAGYRVVVPDLRGYGLNTKPENLSDYQMTHLMSDVHQLIEQQGTDSAIIIAHDWGGVVAWNIAMFYPHLVKKLIILNAPHSALFSRELSGHMNEQYKMSWYIRFFLKPLWPEKLFGADYNRMAKWFHIDRWGYAYVPTEQDLAVYAASYAVPGALTAMLNWYRASSQLRNNTRRTPKVITTPTLVLWGEHDKALSIHLLDGLEDWVPNLELIRINDAGHFVQVDAPKEVNESVVRFLNR